MAKTAKARRKYQTAAIGEMAWPASKESAGSISQHARCAPCVGQAAGGDNRACAASLSGASAGSDVCVAKPLHGHTSAHPCGRGSAHSCGLRKELAAWAPQGKPVAVHCLYDILLLQRPCVLGGGRRGKRVESSWRRLRSAHAPCGGDAKGASPLCSPHASFLHTGVFFARYHFIAVHTRWAK